LIALPTMKNTDTSINQTPYSNGNSFITSSQACDYQDTSKYFPCLGGGTDGYSTVRKEAN